jgi:hypothetical protein
MKFYSLNETTAVVEYYDGINANRQQMTITDGLVYKSNHDVTTLEPRLIGSDLNGMISNAINNVANYVTNIDTLVMLGEAVNISNITQTEC